jgi:hypothetical protein
MDTLGRWCFQDQRIVSWPFRQHPGRTGVSGKKLAVGTGEDSSLKRKRTSPARSRVGREGLLFEEVLEGLTGVGVARRSVGRRGTGGVRLRVGSWRCILFDGHAKFVEGAGVLGVLGRDAFRDRLGALELGAGIEEAALFAAVQFGLALWALPIGIESGSKNGAASGTARASDCADHARRAGTELIGAARPAGRRLAIV